MIVIDIGISYKPTVRELIPAMCFYCQVTLWPWESLQETQNKVRKLTVHYSKPHAAPEESLNNNFSSFPAMASSLRVCSPSTYFLRLDTIRCSIRIVLGNGHCCLNLGAVMRTVSVRLGHDPWRTGLQQPPDKEISCPPLEGILAHLLRSRVGPDFHLDLKH